MNPIFKILSILLSYPDEEIQAATGELRNAVAADSALGRDSQASAGATG